ncbi:hypothetical protein [Nocardia sp. NPDC050406]|uniref:hypothetical protein n=1 Tax=Nocardia sp. NPDC050406 TaxID=3364318 RepID=UPI0037B14A36
MTDPTIQSTIDHLLDCHRVCERQIRTSLDLGGAHADHRHIAALTDLAELTRVTADLLDRESPWAQWSCELAADACADIAGQCEELQETECARTCRATARACTTIGSLVPH